MQFATPRRLTAALLAGVALTAAAYAQETAPAPAAEPAAAPAADYDADTVLATVNGVEITLGHAVVMRDRLPDQYQGLPDDVLLKGITDQLVDQTLLAARESGTLDSDPLEVRLHLENERRGTLAARAVQSRIGAEIDEAEVQAAYDAQVAAFVPAKEFSAAHILVPTEEEAKDLAAQIEAGGDFAALATANSKDPGSAPQGGALGWFGAGQMVPEFDAALAGLEPGAVSAPVKTQFGWHVIKLNEVRDTTPPALDAVRGDIENTLRQQQLDAELETLRAGATIDRPEAPIAGVAIRQSDLFAN